MQDSLPAVEPAKVLRATEGDVAMLPLPSGLYKVTVKPHDSNVYLPRRTCETSFPPEVVQAFLDFSFTYLCDNLARHDDPGYVRKAIHNQLEAYVGEADLRGKRLLDFGCGSGASTFCIAEMYPDTEVIGVELGADYIALAERVLGFRKLPNVRFLVSPHPNSLPPEIGKFDFVMLSAVYEHLLPEERRHVLPLVWSSLNPGGLLFINQTPYRYFPLEHHTTGLWFINYLPNALASFFARKLSRIHGELNRSRDWQDLLRGGIRGGTERRILGNLRLSKDGRPTVIQPLNQDRAAYWLSCASPERHRTLKKLVASLFRMTDRLFGTVPSQDLDVVLRKNESNVLSPASNPQAVCRDETLPGALD